MQAKIKTIIVDDEPLARGRLSDLLCQNPAIEVVAECADGAQAIAQINSLKPGLVFLDVQMPEIGGFEVLKSLSVVPLPEIIFVTAHDKFALKAFEVQAVDYLLKPFDRDRFNTALQRALDRLSARRESIIPPLPSGAIKQEQHRLALKVDGKIVLLKPQEIDWIESADNYVIVHAGGAKHIVRETLNSIEGRLSPLRFARLSRSAIVNLDRIKELQPMFHGDYAVILHNGNRLTLSRNYREKLTEMLG